MDKDYLALKRASTSRPSGEWNDDDFDVVCDGVVVGRIMKAAAAPVGGPWLWTLALGQHECRWPTHGYEPTREAAMAIASTPCSPLPANFILLLLGDANNTIFISKIFSQKIWPKNWGGSSNRKFREWFVCGSGSAPPRPLSCR